MTVPLHTDPRGSQTLASTNVGTSTETRQGQRSQTGSFPRNVTSKGTLRLTETTVGLLALWETQRSRQFLTALEDKAVRDTTHKVLPTTVTGPITESDF